MPRYLIVRTFEIDEEAMPEVGRRSKEIAKEEFPEITWEHSHVAVRDNGSFKQFCIYRAPDPERSGVMASASGRTASTTSGRSQATSRRPTSRPLSNPPAQGVRLAARPCSFSVWHACSGGILAWRQGSDCGVLASRLRGTEREPGRPAAYLSPDTRLRRPRGAGRARLLLPGVR